MAQKEKLEKQVHDFVLRTGSRPAARQAFGTQPLWARLRALGTELWLDTGSHAEAAPLWTREFGALTTNNTLLNKEVQSGQYDALILEASRLLAEFSLPRADQILEIGFILNAVHGLGLVAAFDAWVSVEEHTALAHNVEEATRYGRRYHAICPERFIVKLPLTPAGILATRRLSTDGIPVNHTLGFSARQNYVIARLGRPAYVNVFLGRLNSYVADNGLGDGAYVGELAALASQRAIRQLRESGRASTKQIGASLRSGGQVRDLAGLDVLTIPPKSAEQFVKLGVDAATLRPADGAGWRPGVDAQAAVATGLATLWDVGPKVEAAVAAAEKAGVEAMTPADLRACFARQGCGDLLVDWTPSEVQTSAAEGKIPKFTNWQDALASGRIGLDALMNLAGLNSFIGDQKAMDDRIVRLLG